MKIKSCFVLLCAFYFNAVQAQNVDVIALGSCNKTDKPQPLWKPILNNNPDVFIWLGDIIYGDTHDMKELKGKYDKQKAIPDYSKLTTQTKVIGVWDDHDYGWNDAGKGYSKKTQSKEILFDFLETPKDSKVYDHEGAYSSHYLGAENEIKIILLDARYFRDTIKRDENRAYIPNEKGDILGKKQWKWLEAELKESTAKVNIIGSGIQFLPEEHPYEKWANFPSSRKRIFDLVEKTKPSTPIFISGDRHIGEISKIELDGIVVHELTSSGLTHTWSRKDQPEPNKHRIAGDKLAELNFGIIRIDWDKQEVSLELRGEEDVLYRNHTLSIQ